MECQYVATQRGGVALVFEGHRYNKVRDGKDGTVYWRCSRDRQCPGRAVTVNNRVKKANNKHNHPPEASLRTSSGAISVVSTSSSTSSQGQTHANSNNNNNATSGITSNSNSNSFTSLSGSNASVATRLSSNKSLSSSTSSHHHHHNPHHHQQQHHPHHHHHHNIVAHNESPLRLPSSHMTGMPPDMLLDPASAAAAAASFPAIVTETLKYLAAASGNHQMAAAFANSMAQSLNPSLKNMDHHVPFRSGNSNRSSQSSHNQPAVHISPGEF